MTRSLALLFVVVAGATVFAEAEADRAKTLFFDRKYSEARQAWQAVRSGGGPDGEAASYWIARCSENLGEYERALGEYGTYLSARPADRVLAEEARTSRVGLASRLYKAGATRHLGLLTEALADPGRTVRYFAALQLSTLGAEAGRPAVPVLKKIVAEEKDEDLVERAKLGLLRLEPTALALAPLAAAPGLHREAAWIRVRIYGKGQAKPKVSVNLPVALAEMVFKSLPEDARSELRRKGWDANNFWGRLRKLGPSEIISIDGDDGERVQIWLE